MIAIQIALILAALFAPALLVPACGEEMTGSIAGKYLFAADGKRGYLAEKNITGAAQQKKKDFRKVLGRPGIGGDIQKNEKAGNSPLSRVVGNGSRARWSDTDRLFITVLLLSGGRKCR